MILMATIALFSCKKDPSDSSSKVMAEVYGNQLTYTQMMEDLEGKLGGSDSTAIMEDYITNWVRNELIYQKAQDELTTEEKDKTELLDQYYRDLLIHTFQQKVLTQNLDLNVSDEEIETYYNEHSQNFELKENIVRLIFFKLPNTTPNLNTLWYKFNAGGKANLDQITYASVNGGGNFHRDEDSWLDFNDILKEIPITTYNQESYLSNHKTIRVADDKFTYFVQIIDFRIKNSISPVERERNRIRRIIVNKRKSELLQQIEEQIVKDAYASDKVRIP